MLSEGASIDETHATASKPVYGPEVSSIETRMDLPSPSHCQLTPLTHSAMYQAFDVTEVTALIRQELRGFELKSMVLVSRQWWKAFGPYLWENIYIDANPEQDDRKVIFRNGLAARCLTLSIYDPADQRGVVKYVTEKCCNITQLHLKLFASGLVISNAGFIETKLLDSLFDNLPNISDLTISIAHEDLQPEVLWCVTRMLRLKRLTINGGLRGSGYIMRKNWKCNWPLLVRIARECQNLETLSVAWESRTSEERIMGATPPVAWALEARAAVDRYRVESLKWLNISDCEVHDSVLDVVYQMCPNLRGISFKSITTTPQALAKNIQKLTQCCPSLRSFEFNDLVSTNRNNYTSVLLDRPILGLGSLAAHLGTLNENNPDFDRISQQWHRVHITLTNLDLSGIDSYQLLFNIMAKISGLSRLTLSGYLTGKRCDDYSVVETYYNNDKFMGHRLPKFACQDTLQTLDVTRLEFYSFKCHKLFFDRVQNMPQLKRLEVNHRHIQAARLKETSKMSIPNLRDISATPTESSVLRPSSKGVVATFIPTALHMLIHLTGVMEPKAYQNLTISFSIILKG
ncbi:hypothetical protein BGX26_008473 [Mortierella sp. AD094]|nr:hypothetical protein BGX26_008473 [Mortierella sp. AD094]